MRNGGGTCRAFGKKRREPQMDTDGHGWLFVTAAHSPYLCPAVFIGGSFSR